MKNLITILTLLFITITASAQIMQTAYEFELAYMPTGAAASFTTDQTYFDTEGGVYQFVDPLQQSYTNDIRVSFDVEFIFFDSFFVGGRLGTVFGLTVDNLYGIQGLPEFMDSLFKIGYRYKNIELGMERFCNHPVLPSAHANYITSLDSEIAWGKFYLRVGGRF